MAPNRIIIDTDPVGGCLSCHNHLLANHYQGVDDVLAMLLAFSAKPEELEVLMLSVQFGNIDVQK
jgi:inosine-uridine nucleoside N-ribohydrolase